jgi:glucose/arabinose dehydrogenase
MSVLHIRSLLLAALLSFLGLGFGAQAATLAPGFTETRVATGLASPTAMAFAPDERLFIAEQGGALRVIRDDALLAQPFLTLNVNAMGERGLLGVAFDPNFVSNRYVYVYYTTSTSPVHNRVSRFTASAANPDVVAAGTEVTLLDLPALSSATNHNGGAIHFGPDGKLYIAVGDNANSANSQSLASPLGKLLRINADGSIPSDNPFFSQTTGINQAIYARGLRNPFNFSIDPTDGRMLLNDVGQDAWEEVNDVTAGANFGWPQTEGPSPAGVPGVTYPTHSYENAGANCAITGAALYRPTITIQFPPAYRGGYFFGDYCGGFIRMLSPPGFTTATDIATGIASLVDIQVSPNGLLYYLARGGGEVFAVNFTDYSGPRILTQPRSITVVEGQPATFSVSAAPDPWGPLRYQWYRNGSRIPGATNSSTGLTTTKDDNGARFYVVINSQFGLAVSETATLTVLNTITPTGTITAPVNGTGFRVGTPITFSGTATDPSDGTLPPSAFTWQVDINNNGEVRQHMPPTSGIRSGTFTIPDRSDNSPNMVVRVTLTVRDSSGSTHTSFVEIRPQTSYIQIDSNVPGARLTLDGVPITAPYNFTSIQGSSRTLGAVTPQTVGGIAYDFVSWSDGGQATHQITTPDQSTVYTALFKSAAASTVFSDNFETNRGWTLPSNRNTATRGRWQRGDPQTTVWQPGTCDGPSVNCMVTGLAAGDEPGSADVDDGVTSVQSPPMTMPAGGVINLRFRYFFAHNQNATYADYFRVAVVRADGTWHTVFARSPLGGVLVGAWTTQTVNLSEFAGQTIRLRFEVADAAAGSIIEGGFDNVSVTRQ